VQYQDSTVQFLAETMVASRLEIDLSDAGLGHVAFAALLQVYSPIVGSRE
jgi:hypothetical protein